MKALPMLAVCLSGPVALALEPLDTRGLSVIVERIAQPTVVDGVAFEIQVAQGADVGRLAQRIQDRWQKEGSDLRRLEKDGWDILSRLRGQVSELIQWRAAGADPRLVHSELDTGRRIAGPSPPPFALPPRCAWGRTVEGETGAGRFVQRTGVCRDRPEVAAVQLQSKLVAAGWVVRQSGAGSFELSLGGEPGRLSILPATEGDESALVWIAAGDLQASRR